MSDELKAAAERLIGVGVPGLYLPEDGARDAETVARAYLADLAAREAEERERALPIYEAWLKEQHYRRDGNGEWSNRHIVLRQLQDGSYGVFITGGVNTAIYIGNHLTNRGELLDLMVGLKIPTKGGGK